MNRTLPTGGSHEVTETGPDNGYQVTTIATGRVVRVSAFASNSVPLGQVHLFYDGFGRLASTVDARNGATTYEYDALDRITAVTGPAPGTGQPAPRTTYTYDALGRVQVVRLPDGSAVTNEYLPTGELVRRRGDASLPIDYAYDHRGRLVSQTTWRNATAGTGAAVSTWTYDSGRGWLTSRTYGGSNGPSFTYTAAGRVSTSTSPRGVVTSHRYSDGGDLEAWWLSDPAVPGVTNQFDRLGRLSRVDQGSAAGSAFNWDVAGNLLSETHLAGPLAGLVTSNRFDELQRRTQVLLTTTAGSLLASNYYAYDFASRLSLAALGQHQVTYQHDPQAALVTGYAVTNAGVGRLSSQSTFDQLERLQRVEFRDPTGAPVTLRGYTYNDLSQRVRTEAADGSFWNFEYDRRGQVTTGNRFWSGGERVAGQQFGFTYDDIGNRLTGRSGGDIGGRNQRTTTLGVNDRNEITDRTTPGYLDVQGAAQATATVTVNGQATTRQGEYFRQELSVNNAGGSVWLAVTNQAQAGAVSTNSVGRMFLPAATATYAYDAEGNLLADSRWTNQWDAAGRLVRTVSRPDSPAGSWLAISYGYDPAGRRTSKVVSNWTGSAWALAAETHFVYDGWQLLAELTAGNVVSNRYLWGLDLSGTPGGAGGIGGLLAADLATDTGRGVFSVCADGNGNVMALVNATNGTVGAVYEYGPFGELLRASGPVARSNPFRWSTKYQDDETGLSYYGYRYYTAADGRWWSRDPLGEAGGVNLYGFVGNDPLNGVDPLGLFEFTDLLPNILERFPHVQEDEPSELAQAASLIVGVAKCHTLLSATTACATGKGFISAAGNTVQSLWELNKTLVKYGPVNPLGPFNLVRDQEEIREKFRKTAAGLTDLAKLARAGEARKVICQLSVDLCVLITDTPGSEKFCAALGRLEGQAAFEVLLTALTAGTGTATKTGIKMVDEIVDLGRAVDKATPPPLPVSAVGPAAKGGVPRIYCFAAGTKVATPEGERNIEDIKQGDLVWAYDFEQGKMVERPIKELVRSATEHWYELTIGDKNVKVTGGHPFWVESQQDWVYARNLRVGMTLRDPEGSILPIQSIRFTKLSTPEPTFNFEVEQHHNYFAGSAGSTVLVHNTDPFDIHFSRPPGEINASQVFTDPNSPWKGRTLGDAVAEARRLGRLPDGLTLNATRWGEAETLVAANNRTLWIAQQAGLRNVSVAGLESGSVAKTVMEHVARNGGPFCPP